MTRERPKVQPKPEPTDKTKVLMTGDDVRTGFFKSLLNRLMNARGVPAYSLRLAERTAPKHPSDLFAEKRAGKHGGFKDWELNKIWAPKKDKDGGIFLPKGNDHSRQQRRHRQFAEAYAYMAEHFGGEPRRIRREMARAKTRLFWKTEQAEKALGRTAYPGPLTGGKQ